MLMWCLLLWQRLNHPMPTAKAPSCSSPTTTAGLYAELTLLSNLLLLAMQGGSVGGHYRRVRWLLVDYRTKFPHGGATPLRRSLQEDNNHCLLSHRINKLAENSSDMILISPLAAFVGGKRWCFRIKQNRHSELKQQFILVQILGIVNKEQWKLMDYILIHSLSNVIHTNFIKQTPKSAVLKVI